MRPLTLEGLLAAKVRYPDGQKELIRLLALLPEPILAAAWRERMAYGRFENEANKARGYVKFP